MIRVIPLRIKAKTTVNKRGNMIKFLIFYRQFFDYQKGRML